MVPPVTSTAPLGSRVAMAPLRAVNAGVVASQRGAARADVWVWG
ncbi:hypothetical protein A176_002942 [Myxococcus hansupus]|uniref:Uncharacterized protein n=1 Tax=Pseudomyxococcus hansupus TaxID=1297742 RepID=A0A0H4WXH3_9BACT|nr:hypothetical protein A176_002942 [Myxococcus hansupus]